MNNSSESSPLVDSVNVKPKLIIVGEFNVQLWSITPAERHRRSFARVGVTGDANENDEPGGTIVAVRADYLLGPDLITAIATRSNTVLTTADGNVAVAANVTADDLECGLDLLRATTLDGARTSASRFDFLGPAELGSAYDDTLRKRATPFVLSYRDTAIDVLEAKTFGAAYKGATDFVTKWCWPRPARAVTRWAAARGISPNSITTVSLVLVLVALWLFSEGHFLSAIPIAWAMTFLDTVDGKLARVTVTSSAWGNIYDHGIDLIHPPFWWYGWYLGVLPVASTTVASSLELALWVILGGYLVGRLVEGLFVLCFKIESHIWQPVDYFFRTITARRNPNLAILTLATCLGRPDVGFVCVALWTVICLAFHAIRLVQAVVIHRRGGRIESWLNPQN